jgi:uncharacterized C2H2 Zn-finger protein
MKKNNESDGEKRFLCTTCEELFTWEEYLNHNKEHEK